jgi:hypothetical protein
MTKNKCAILTETGCTVRFLFICNPFLTGDCSFFAARKNLPTLCRYDTGKGCKNRNAHRDTARWLIAKLQRDVLKEKVTQ